MPDYACSKDRFLKDVAEHQLEVLRDDGLYRHLRFKRPNSGVYSFSIVTWPGYLAYYGDMGCYVFSRLPDMFEFFRKAAINPGYWREKVQAADYGLRPADHDGVREYTPERFREALGEDVEIFLESRDDWAPAKVAEFRQAVEDELLRRADDGMHEAIRSAMDFKFEDQRPFHDFYEHDLHEYTFHFIWCCYALVWGIGQYDALKTAVPAEVG